MNSYGNPYDATAVRTAEKLADDLDDAERDTGELLDFLCHQPIGQGKVQVQAGVVSCEDRTRPITCSADVTITKLPCADGKHFTALELAQVFETLAYRARQHAAELLQRGLRR